VEDSHEHRKEPSGSIKCWKIAAQLVASHEGLGPILIKQKIKEKRRLRRGWHRLQTPEIE
jgi:hypothetical protein